MNGGKFGERWTKIANAYSLGVVEIALAPGVPLDPSVLEQVCTAHPDATAVFFQASETSTGTQMPVKEIVGVVKKHGMLAVCDAITALGVIPLPMDEWGMDVLITGSQKAMMLPPGMAFIALSKAAWLRTENANLPRFYFDLRKELKAHLTNQTAWTPAISLVLGLNEAIHMMKEEGIAEGYARHQLLALATRNAVEALGLEILAKKSPSASVTAVLVPPSIADGKKIPKIMRDKYGVTIAGGQDELEGKIFRLSHFGYCSYFDVTTGISCLELTLSELGYPVEFGKGVGAALRTFSKAGVKA